MNQLHKMNVRVLLNTRIDPNSVRNSTNSPYPSGTSMGGNTPTPDLSPTPSTSDFSENPCPSPMSPPLPSFILPPPVVRTEGLYTTIATMDGRKINADLIVGLPPLFVHPSFSPPPSSSVQDRRTIPRFSRCCHPSRLITRAGLPHMSCLLSSWVSRRMMGSFDFLITRTFLSSGMQPMLLGPENLAVQLGTRYVIHLTLPTSSLPMYLR